MIIRRISIIITFLLFWKFSFAANSIFITQDNYTKNSIIITCTISGDNAVSYKAYLRCPLSDTNICYTDCTKSSRYVNGLFITPPELKSIEKCERTIMEDDHIRIKYTINTKDIKNKNGEWFCSFQDINSKSIKLKIETTKNPTNPSMNEKITTKKSNLINPRKNNKKVPSTIIPVVTLVDIIKERATKQNNPKIIFISKSNAMNNDFDFKTFVTKYEVVIGIICLLVLSILLNFIFCIRDSMIKQFIDNLKGNSSSNKYLLCCLCQSEPESISATAKLDKILSNQSDYISNGASNCSKTDIFNVESQRPLLTNVYQSHDGNSTIPTNIVKSSSLHNHDMSSPRIMPINYDQCYMTSPRPYGPYIYNPYLMSRSNSGATAVMNDPINQRHSYVFPSQFIPQNLATEMDIHSKKHASDNDIDLIRHCDSQQDLPTQ